MEEIFGSEELMRSHYMVARLRLPILERFS